MFGCGNYPAFPEIRKSIEDETTCQVKRLRHHPSMAIYAGNNEDYQVQEQYSLVYDYEDKNPENWLKTDFPARYIYEKASSKPIYLSLHAIAYDMTDPARSCCSTLPTHSVPPRLALGRWQNLF